VFTSLPTPPPQPPWEGMHPLVVHFPIALLLFAAVFIVLAMIVPKRGWWFSVSALILLIGGTAGAFVSVSTGVAARDKVEEGEDEMFEVMQKHEDAMKQAQNVFTWLTGIYAGIVVLPLLAKSLRSLKFAMPVNFLFLVALMGANLFMASGAHLGGRLVHQYGVKSALAPEPGAAATEAKEEAPAEEAKEDADAAAKVDEMEAPASDAEKETPDAEGEKKEGAAPESEKQAPAAEPKTEAPAAETKPEAPAAEAKKEAPAPDPAKDGAAKEAKEL